MSRTASGALLATGCLAACLFGLVGGVLAAEGREPERKVAPVDAAGVEEDPRLPPIPYARLEALALRPREKAADADSELIAITAEQWDRIQAIVTVRNRFQGAVNRVRGEFQFFLSPNLRDSVLVEVFRQIETDDRTRAQREISAVLTPDQRALLRRKARGQPLDEQTNGGKWWMSIFVVPTKARDVFTVEDAARRNDLLTIVEQATVQESLELTDDQYLSVLDLRAEAAGEAREVVLELVEARLATRVKARDIDAVARTTREKLIESWNARVLALLTPEQQIKLGHQRWGFDPVNSLLHPKLAEQLKLEPEQINAIRKHLGTHREPKYPTSIVFMTHREWLTQLHGMNPHYRAAVGVLTPDQLTTFCNLTGYPRPVYGPQRARLRPELNNLY